MPNTKPETTSNDEVGSTLSVLREMLQEGRATRDGLQQLALKVSEMNVKLDSVANQGLAISALQAQGAERAQAIAVINERFKEFENRIERTDKARQDTSKLVWSCIAAIAATLVPLWVIKIGQVIGH